MRVTGSAIAVLGFEAEYGQGGGRVPLRLLSVCEPVMAEALLLAETAKYSDLENQISERYLPVTIPDGIGGLVANIRRELATGGAHRGLSAADLVIAATAIRLELTVLHEDGDYETMTRFVPEPRQRRISAGVQTGQSSMT